MLIDTIPRIQRETIPPTMDDLDVRLALWIAQAMLDVEEEPPRRRPRGGGRGTARVNAAVDVAVSALLWFYL